MQISHEIFSRKFPSSLLIFRKRLFKNENLGDYCRNFMISPAQSSSLSLSLSSSLSSSSSSLGSLSNDNGDGDGYENVTSKVNSRCFQLYRAYSISFNSSNVGKCFQLELNFKRLYRSSGKEKERRCLVFTFSTKREIRHFHVAVVR